ncbi:hypothetical protein RPO_05155 [Rickettsia rickettsii str. Arizona]|uniref:Uncharacterized protein n=1 Tax=Rickettsia rickettsii (strain Sheila Smith) TaxID=392021 RepID=A0A0H3AVF8_RICRS|nr:hypothetical protein A1G_05090 [Rickettsia rickettsii str. 'Sheila Smith']AFB21918.1 hypothetical protein RPN_01895 [Rickettsia rickettsii str. Brazil]AFB23864.1 hypothetical protein RPL_05150 [Rickettsia rickettsii str. Colombia]AFB25209.1 hypothetical protein RPO_05155 [Rickettsia rickettsii str. Arizona]AFB27889.1 hypothetical protein RPJ_05105 [Rickettsia rickettsii str. Hino]AFB29210.1 hypothetical protein RPK_05065 [Rickettsia rickettsii str. Hlp\
MPLNAPMIKAYNQRILFPATPQNIYCFGKNLYKNLFQVKLYNIVPVRLKNTKT